jgi:hypothetical protein
MLDGQNRLDGLAELCADQIDDLVSDSPFTSSFPVPGSEE